jgi:site-specific DNA recombinase
MEGTLGIYVRVSEVGDREGDSFVSPKLQRQKAESYALSQGYATADEIFEDLDVSGGAPLDERPALARLLALIEAGELSGMVVATQDRAARSLDLLRELQRRIRKVGGALLAADNPALAAGEARGFAALPTELRALVDEAIRDEAKVRISDAQRQAIADGKPIFSRSPLGVSLDNQRVVWNERAGLVLECFKRRAAGASWTELCSYLDESDARPWKGARWSRPVVVRMIANRIYLGEVAFGEHVNASAHEPLPGLTEELFLAANRSKVARRERRSEPLPTLLNGLVRCANCGMAMQVNRKRRADGTERIVYYCPARDRSTRAEHCTSASHCRADTLDEYVEMRLLEFLFDSRGPLAEAVSAKGRIAGLEEAVALAEGAFTKLTRNPAMIEAMGEDAYLRSVTVARGTLEDAKANLAEVRSQASVIEALTSGEELTPQTWRALSVQDKRVLLRGLFDRIVVGRTEKMRKWKPSPFSVLLVWRGNINPADAGDGFVYAPEPDQLAA